MISELTIKISGEDKTLKKKIGPFHTAVVMDAEDPTIQAAVNDMMTDFKDPIEDVVVICKMTL